MEKVLNEFISMRYMTCKRRSVAKKNSGCIMEITSEYGKTIFDVTLAIIHIYLYTIILERNA
jgi:hypothetical protein